MNTSVNELKQYLKDKYLTTSEKNDSSKDYFSSLNDNDQVNIISSNDILRAGRYVLYEFNDIEKNFKSINPIFSKDCIDNSNNRDLLSIIFEDVPYYFLDGNFAIDEKTDSLALPMTRDSSKTDVPSYLQTDFWSVWFNECWGDIQNSIILNIYNMLQCPMMNENQYLNSNIFTKIANSLLTNTLDKNILTFKDASEDYYDLDQYSIDYSSKLSSIIDDKIESIYSILNYKPEYNKFLADWCDSLYYSSVLDTDSIDKEKSIYKLQDIQYELLRRKFAGSSTLYNITLASIDRQGSVNRSVESGKFKLTSSSNQSFINKRRIKIVNLKGIRTKFGNSLVNYNPLKVISCENGNNNGLPMDIVVPLYYTSSDVGGNPFNAYEFYNSDQRSVEYLRENSSIIDWSDLSYISDVLYPVTAFLKLDETELVSTPSGSERVFKTTDAPIEYTNSEGLQIKLSNSTLDLQQTIFNKTDISGVMFDVNANKILYHENSIQKLLKNDYPYVTYSIANGNSLSLMDKSILEYMGSATDRKSRVQDNIDIGTQINYYLKKGPKVEVEDNFFTMGYQTTFTSNVDTVYTKNHRFAILYYVSVKYYCECTVYENEKFVPFKDKYYITDVKKIPITRIFLGADFKDDNGYTPNTNSSYRLDTFSSAPIYDKLIQGNVGILPLTYNDYVYDKVLGSSSNNNSIKVGIENGVLYDEASDNNYTLCNFVFADSDVKFNGVFSNISPVDLVLHRVKLKNLVTLLDENDIKYDGDYHNYSIPSNTNMVLNESLSFSPSTKDHGCVYFCVYRDGQYFWSEPIFYTNMKAIPDYKQTLDGNILCFNDNTNIRTYFPDWCNLSMQINSYLGTVKESASPLRYIERNYPGSYHYMWNGFENIVANYRNGLYKESCFFNLNEYVSVINDFNNHPTIWIKKGASLNKNNIYEGGAFYATFRKNIYDSSTKTWSIGESITQKFSNLNSLLYSEDGFDFDSDTGECNSDLYIYDIRHYSEDIFSYQPYIKNGTIRELYSYAPSIYKLAYSVYIDNGILRTLYPQKFDEKTQVLNDITSIRYFNRSVWDTIYVERYPDLAYKEGYQNAEYDIDEYGNKIVYAENYDLDIFTTENNILKLNDCIQQQLTKNVEVENNKTLFELEAPITVNYNGELDVIDSSSHMTIVNTTLYPVNYSKEPFMSSEDGLSSALYKNDCFSVKMPITPEKGSLKYYADINVNLINNTESFLSNPYNYGDNVEIIYDSKNKKSVITLTDRNIVNDSSQNYVIIPLKLPKLKEQTVNTSDTHDESIVDYNDVCFSNSNYLDSFTIKDFKISSEFSKLLDSRAYYNEIVIPIATDLEGDCDYIYKCDAIRLYKEGTYYVTVKYPLMILPMFDYDYVKTQYPIVYGSIRFKVEVKGSPKNFSGVEAQDILESKNYQSSNIVDNIKNGVFVNSSKDNRTYPHRLVNIRLYAQICDGIAGKMLNNEEDYTFSWDLIASNVESEAINDIVLLDNNEISSGIFIKKPVSMFMSKNFNMPFFLAKQLKTSDFIGDGKMEYDPSSADDDLIDPITVLNTALSNKDKEKLSIKSISDLDKITLYSGKDYNLLFDFTSNVTELSYTNNYYKNSKTWSISETEFNGGLDEEKLNYSRLSNVFDKNNRSEYVYDSMYISSKVNNISGYAVVDDNWTNVGSNTINDNVISCFGNPYSKLSSNNSLLTDDTIDIVNNSFNFSYVIENIKNNTSLAYKYSSFINDEIPTWTLNKSSYVKKNSIRTFNEKSILNTLYSNFYSLFNLNNINMFLSEMSSISPNIRALTLTNENVNVSNILIDNDAYDLFSYKMGSLDIMNIYDKSNFTIKRDGLYNNNLIKSSYYTTEAWTGSLYGGSWVPDASYGKDVYEVLIPTKNSFVYMNYITGNNAYSGTYEVAINMLDKGCKIYAAFLKDNAVIGDRVLLTNDKESCFTLVNPEIGSSTKNLFEKINNSFEEPSTSYVKEGVDYYQYTSSNEWEIFSNEITVKNFVNGIRFFILSESENVLLRLGKPIVRLSVTDNSHQLGLSNVLNKGVITNNHFIVPSTYYLLYKNKETDNIITTVQLSNKIKGGYTFAPEVEEFVFNYNIAPKKDSSKMKKMLEPWMRNIMYLDTDDGGYFSEKAYIIQTDSIGKKSVVTTKICSSLYSNVEASYINNKLLIKMTSNNDIKSEIENLFLLKVNENNLLTLENEKISAVTDVFNVDNVLNGKSSDICITNIQLLSKDTTETEDVYVQYELEYLPIIYDESKNHISVNFLVNEKR